MLIAETQTHNNRERIYQEISAGRKDLSSGFQEILVNDRNGSAQRIGFLVGYASAFRMHSNFLTQARTTFGGHEFADYYHFAGWTAPQHWHPAVPAEEPNFVNRPGAPEHRNGVDHEGRIVFPTVGGEELLADVAVRQNGQADNGHDGTNGVGSAHNAAATNGNDVVNGNGVNGDPQLTITPDYTGFMAPPVDCPLHGNSPT